MKISKRLAKKIAKQIVTNLIIDELMEPSDVFIILADANCVEFPDDYQEEVYKQLEMILDRMLAE